MLILFVVAIVVELKHQKLAVILMVIFKMILYYLGNRCYSLYTTASKKIL